MSHVLTIAARDVRERSFMFLTAAIIAVLPFIAFIRGTVQDPRAVTLVYGLIASFGGSVAVALGVGASMIGRDLAERRLSFYFSKPVAPAAIWFGKLIGAVATVLITFAIIAIPTYLAGHAAWATTLPGSPQLLAAAALLTAMSMLVIAHAFSTVIRSHSPLIALDVVLLAAGVITVWLLVGPVLTNLALDLAQRIVMIAAFAIPVVLAGAGAWQLSRGRTDARCSHRELSRAFWISMAAVIALLGLYVAWVFSAGPHDLRNREAIVSPRADWIAITGDAKNRDDYAPTFLVNAKSGVWSRTVAQRWGGIQFTRRGDAAVMLSAVIEHVTPFTVTPRVRIGVQKLDGLGKTVDTGVTAPVFGSDVVLSDDLQRMANFDQHIVSVYDVSSRALLASARVPAGDQAEMFFVSPDVVRIYAGAPDTSPRKLSLQDLYIYELNVPARSLEETGRLHEVPSMGLLRVSADGSTLAVGSGSLRIADARTGAIRTTLPIVKGRRLVTFLANGDVSFVDATTHDAVVRIFGTDGKLVREIGLGHGIGGRVAELVAGRKLVVSVRRNPITKELATGSDVFVVDIQTGAIERVERSVSLRTQYWTTDPRMPAVHPSEYVISDRLGTLWRWNPLTGAKTKIL